MAATSNNLILKNILGCSRAKNNLFKMADVSFKCLFLMFVSAGSVKSLINFFFSCGPAGSL